MEITVAAGGSSLSYPYWKVVLAGERAEVAELSCEGESSENLYFHEDLVARLRTAYPELDGTDFIAGWLTRSGDEAVLSLHLGAGGLGRLDVGRIDRALSDWCAAAGIRRVTIADPFCRGRDEHLEDVGEDDWALP
jgi:hypothetical protein